MRKEGSNYHFKKVIMAHFRNQREEAQKLINAWIFLFDEKQANNLKKYGYFVRPLTELEEKAIAKESTN